MLRPAAHHLLLAVLLTLAAPSRPHRIDYKPRLSERGTTFYLSSDAPLTRHLSAFPPVTRAASLVLAHVSLVESAVLARLAAASVPPADDLVRVCNYHAKDAAWPAAVHTAFALRGWPEPDVACVTDVYDADARPAESPRGVVDELYNALLARGDAIHARVGALARQAGLNFTRPDFVYNATFETKAQRCELHPAAAVRVGERWYLEHGITNAPKEEQLPAWSRHAVAEYARLDGGRLGDNLVMRLAVRPPDGDDSQHRFRNDATTVITTTRGEMPPSSFMPIFVEDNPALMESLDKSRLFIQQASDALTPSSLAILFLPLGLNLVPIALLTEVSTMTMLLYTLMSDVLTVVPLGIKGAELIFIGRQMHRTILVRVSTSVNGTKPEAAAAEIFAAECRAQDNIAPTGIAFVTLSVVFLIGGVVSEFAAREYTNRRKQRYLEELEEVRPMVAAKWKWSSPSFLSGSFLRGKRESPEIDAEWYEAPYLYDIAKLPEKLS